MSLFKEEFYTDDFDQEMLDFIEENYNVDTVNGWYVKRCLSYHFYDNDFYVSEYLGHGVYLTKQQFKEKIGMTNKDTFTKDDLVAGKHVVECRNGERYVVMCDGILVGLNGGSALDSFNYNLLAGYRDMDIVKVYNINYPDSVKQLLDFSLPYPPLWERTEKSEAQLQYEQCKAKMDELQKELAALEEKL